VDGGEGQLGARAWLHVQSRRVWILHLLEERGKGEWVEVPAMLQLINGRHSQEGDVIELCQVSDIRAGGLPKDMKLCNQLINRHGDQLEEKSLTICSGTDYININYQHVICPSAEIAKVRAVLPLRLFIYVIPAASYAIASVKWISMRNASALSESECFD
jgi:PH domain